MITERIANAAQRAMPAEEGLVRFFDKKSHRLVVSGIAAAIAAIVMFRIPHYDDDWLIILETLVLGVLISFVSCFFANIGKYSAKKFAVSAVISSMVYLIIHSAVHAISDLVLPVMNMTMLDGIFYIGIRELPRFAVALAIVLLCTLVSAIKRRRAGSC